MTKLSSDYVTVSIQKVKLRYYDSLKRKTWQSKNKLNLTQATYNWTSSSGGTFACFSCTKKNNVWHFFTVISDKSNRALL